jgi:hypothetical protein
MAHRITLDPHLEIMPDHAGPHYDVLRTVLIRNGMTEDKAIQALNDSWTCNRNERIQRWEQQTIDDAKAAKGAQQQQKQEEEEGE